MNQQNIDYVLRSVEQRDIRFVRLWFVDILGRLKNFAISPEDLEVAFEEGIGFDGSAIEGFATPEEADMLAFPDASTFQILPWRPSHNGVARVFCDVCTPDRKPFAGDPRDALRRMFYKAEKAGYLLNVGAELEYYYFPDEHTPEPLDNVGYFDLSVSDAARDLRRNTVLTLEKMSVPVEYTFHAAGRSQHGMSDSLVKPFLTVISLPLTIITLGIFQLVVNSFMLELASYLSVNLLGAGISIAGFGSAFMGSILVSIMRSILDSVARN